MDVTMGKSILEFGPGRWVRNRRGWVKGVILEKLKSGPKRWTDLWNDEKIKGAYKSPKLLTKALRELERTGLIKHELINKKQGPYSITKLGNELDLRNHTFWFMMFNSQLSKTLTEFNNEQKEINDKIQARLFIFRITIGVLNEISELDNEARFAAEYWFKEEMLPRIFWFLSSLNQVTPNEGEETKQQFFRELDLMINDLIKSLPE
jgi:DNA-binding PadR family transcriptional regulator